MADYYQLPVNTVRRKTRTGEIRAQKFGTERRRLYRVSAAEIQRIDQHGTTP